jgi:hypothetical protein
LQIADCRLQIADCIKKVLEIEDFFLLQITVLVLILKS